MKKFNKLVALAAAASLIALFPGVSEMRASAATPTTHYLQYDTDKHEWRLQTGAFAENSGGKDLYYLNEGDEKVQDGDILVVMPNEESASGNINITVNARLSNLTINGSSVVITVGGADECHVNADSYAAITGDITNAYVYNNATCTFHSNVSNLRMIATIENTVNTTVTVGGTVSYASTANAGGVLKEYYNFKAGTFDFDGVSGLMTDPSNYSTSGNGPAAAAPAASTTTAAAPAQSQPAAASGEYDDVPKTGEGNLSSLLLAASALCFVGCFGLRKKSR
ncbi:MAG: hypothetical protein NC092_07740 [Butyrivibrio sp.]|nr:hypothetical protein [Muribaculum sp.]MCM1552565.1 hypothetical protein [Butyrivibrio sp.]